VTRTRAATAQRLAVRPARVRAIRRRLLDWYELNRRDLPWRRRSGNAYAQWVAEIMLQQTQVDTVRAYYEPFLERFPDVRALGSARLDEVLKRWEGLGYYRRAVNLHRAAQQLVAQGSAIPGSADGLRELPGIGRYTSAAIASIAYGEPVAAVDGNVTRVLSRLFGLAGDTAISGSGRARLTASVQSIADRLLDARRPGDFNQAWMDLGATVCRPVRPKCHACPLATLCQSRPSMTRAPPSLSDDSRDSRVRIRRTRAQRPASPRVVQTVLLAWRGEALFMRQRPPNGLWSGLWEFPIVAERAPDDSPEDAIESNASLVSGALRALGLRARGAPLVLETVAHRLTHRRYEFRPIAVAADDRTRCPPRTDARGRWITPGERARRAISTAHRRILALAQRCRNST